MKKKFPSPKTTTVDQSQVREVNSRQPSRSSWRKCGVLRAALRARGMRIRASRSAAPDERGGVDRERDPRAAGDDDHAADRRPDARRSRFRIEPAQRVRLLEPRRR